MNNLHRRRMQEKPYPPLHDYIRVVSHGTLIQNKVSTKNGKVWVCYEKDGKLVYERKECGSAKGNTHQSTTIDINAQEAFYIGVDRYYATSSDIKIFDASKAVTLSKFPYNLTWPGILALGKTVELIDLTGCDKLKTLKLAGYNQNYHTTHCNEIRINGCTSATLLQTRGQGTNPRIFGLLDCKNLKEIVLEGMSPCYDDGNWIEDLDLRDFENLSSLTISSSRITSLDNLPAGLTTLNCRGCTGITSLDNLPAGLTTLDCGSITVSNADFSNYKLTSIIGYNFRVNDNTFIPPITLKTCEITYSNIKYADFSNCTELTSFSAWGFEHVVGGIKLPTSVKTVNFNGGWGKTIYPMPDLSNCMELTTLGCSRCTNIPNLDQQAFIDSLPTFTDGSTHTINLTNTGVVAETVAALEAKGWTVQV